MKNRYITSLVVCLLGAFIFVIQGCRDDHNAAVHDLEEHACSTHTDHDEHGHHDDHEGDAHCEDHGDDAQCLSGGDLSLSLKEIKTKECEHLIPAYQCADCRYEVGVVKVSPALLKTHSSNGLIGLTQPRMQSSPVGIPVTAEIRFNENSAAHISPRIGGVILSVNVDIGSQVESGDLLLTIESADLAAAVNDYRKYHSAVYMNRKVFAREQSLYKQKITSEQEFLAAESTLQQEEASLEAARERLLVLGMSERDIARFETPGDSAKKRTLQIRAPISGTIIERHAVVGEVVEPTSAIMFLADLSTVWVWADIYERNLSYLLEQMAAGSVPVAVRQGAFPGQQFTGHLDYVGATMDKHTRTIKVRATINNEKLLLRPGMFCEATILGAADEEVLTIPKSAVLSDEGVYFVYKHLHDDYYVRRPITKGREFSDAVEIQAGITLGETVVSDAAFLLKSDTLRSKMGAGCAD